MASRITRSAARASSRRADRRAQAAEGGGTATEISGLGAELRWLGYGLFSIWIFLSLLSWSPEDAGWFQQGSRQVPTNWLGRFGAWTADSLLFGFGFSAGWFVVLSAALAYASWRLARQLREVQRLGVAGGAEVSSLFVPMGVIRWIGFALLLAGSCTLEAQRISWGASPISFMPGGVLGSVVGSFGDWALGAIGLTLLSLSMIVAGLALFFRFSWLDVTEWVGRKAEALFGLARNQLAERQDRRLGESAAIERADALEEKRRQ
ncbi:MAG: DNA translocase FtsK 4TM domain-containing protein, partial [Betaproteobacteria bacterium]